MLSGLKSRPQSVAMIVVMLVFGGALSLLLAERRAPAPMQPAAFAADGLCLPYSELACGAVRANLPLGFGFDADEGGLTDRDGQGLGFTMAQPSTTGTYRPELLDLDTTAGRLTIRTTRGIQYKLGDAANGGNSLDNALGVGIDAAKKLRVETTLVNPPLGTGNSEQGGIWFGPDEDNYAKLVVASSKTGTTTHHRLQLVREVGGASASANGDEINSTQVVDWSGKTVKLILTADPAGKVAASYTIDGGTEQVLGELTVPASFFTGTLLRENVRAEGITGFAGIFATHRRNATTTGLDFAFGSFGVEEVAPPAAAPNVQVTPDRIVTNDVSGGGAGGAQTVTIRNTGDGAMAVHGIALAGAGAAQFQVVEQPAATVPAGGSTTARIAMAATATGPKGAIAQVKTNDPDAPQVDVILRGLGTAGLGGANEPSLQWILETHEIPVAVGDDDAATNVIHSSTTSQRAALLGPDEIRAQSFRKAGTGPVTVEPLAVFGPDAADPVVRFGRYTAGDKAARTELFPVGNAPASNAQTVAVPGGAREFDPGTSAFGFYSIWPFFADRAVYGEDALNSFSGAIPHHVRVYPLKSKTGAVVPHAFVVATEEHTSGFDFQDVVVVVRNVEPVAPPSNAEIAVENLDRVPFADRLAFNRIQTPNSTTPNGVHDQAVLRVRNTGTDPLRITGLPITGPWQLVDGPTLPHSVPAGSALDLTVKFTATSGSVHQGTLTVQSTDTDEPSVPVQLAGFWQSVSEGGQEPDVAEINRVFGYGTTILHAGQQLNNGGRLVKVGDEIHSAYWKRADLTKPVHIRQLAAFHTQGNTATFRTTNKPASGSPSNYASLLVHAGEDGQSLLPRKNDTARSPGEATWTPTSTQSVFGFKVDGEHSDWTKNTQDSECVTEGRHACGHHVRIWPAEDRSGQLIAHTYLVSMDYSGINYDFNDNVYLVSNVRPEDPANDPSVPKPCTPVACEDIAVATPYALGFDAARAGTVLDKDGEGTGFTYVAPPSAGTGYVKPNLDLDGATGRLEVTTTKGLAFAASNSQDNALGIGLRWPDQATPAPQAITTTLIAPPAGSGQFQQGGLWFGRGEDDYVKLVTLSTPEGTYIQHLKEEDAASGLDFKSPVLALAGKDVALKLVADPVARTVSAFYTVQGAGETALGSYTVPPSWFSEDPEVIDPRIGTSSFAGLFASHRNGPAPLVYAFGDFAVAADTTTPRPQVTVSRPADGTTDVVRDVAIATDLRLYNGGVDTRTLSTSSVRLLRDGDGAPVAGTPGTSGAGDTITFTPGAALAANTSYRFEVTDEVRDVSGQRFVPFTMRFTTGTRSSSDGGGTSAAAFDKVALPTATGAYNFYAQLTMGPDGKLYAGMNDGRIRRFAVNADGTLGQPETITTLVPDYSAGDDATKRLLVGLRFDPASTAENLIVWTSHTTFGFNGMADWAGKITRLSGAKLEQAQDYVTNLPRSTRDHVTNGIDFGPDGKLYVLQGSNSAMGAPDVPWGNRKERVLNAAVLRLDPAAVTNPPLNAKTEEGGTYDPSAPGAPLTVFGSGIRNAYDMVWHSNGQLYVPTNGSAAGGATPATPSTLPAACRNRVDDAIHGDYTAPSVAGLPNVTQTQHDWLFRVVEGGYYGHPNPERCEWVLNGGDPTAGADGPAEVPLYPDGTQPDRNYRGAAYDFGLNKSPNGVIEYRSDAFGGSLKGKLLVVRYSNNDDVIVLDPSKPNGDIATSQTGIAGLSGFKDPLDITEDRRTGNLYVAEYDQTGTGQRITLLRARQSAPSTRVPLPFSLTWGADEGGSVRDKDGEGTGFRAVQPSSNGGSYLPGKLDVNTAAGALTITTTKGIQYKTATTTTNGNSLDNGLAVGVDASKKLRLETTVVNPPKGAGAAEQGGLWFGADEDNYVKLVVASARNSATPHRVQLVREVGGIAGLADEINTTDTTLDFSSSTVRLILETDPATGKATASYRVGTGEPVPLGELSIPAGFFDAGTGFAGVFASHRNNTTTTGLPFTFGEFAITTEAPANRAPSVTAPADQDTVAGAAATVAVQGSDPDGDALTWSASGLPAGLEIDPVTGTISGTVAEDAARTTPYAVTVRADDDGIPSASATATFAWTVGAAAPAPPFESVKVNFQNATAVVPDGHVRDYGQPFGLRTAAGQGTGLRYGWVQPGTATPLDLSVGGSTPGNGRDRNRNADQRYDTLMHMQADDVSGTFNGTAQEGAWEIAVPDGTYDVTAAAGESQAGVDAESHTLRAEGRTVVSGFVPSGADGTATRHATATVRAVEVTDGRLTIDAVGGTNTKVNFVEVTKVTATVNRPPVLEAPADQSTREGVAVTVGVEGSDPDAGDVVTYAATGLPAGLSIAPGSGVISGTVAAGAARTAPYAVTVTATDRAGAATSATFAWTITDGTAPTVSTVRPAAGSAGVDVDAGIEAVLSEAVAESGLTGKLTLREQGAVSDVPATVTYSAATRTLTLVPTGGLEPSRTYTATLAAGVQDAAGNAGSAATTWSFTTAAPEPADLVASPGDVDFGDVQLGERVVKEVTLANAGGAKDASVRISSVTATGVAFTEDATPPVVLAPGQKATVKVTFAPATAGAHAGELVIEHDGANAAQRVALSGTGTPAPAAALVADPAALAFGSLPTGESRVLGIRVTNTGDAPATVTAATLGGTDAAQFRAPSERPVIAAGASAQVPVTFAPASAGAKTATLTLAYTGGTGATVTVALTGTGTTVTQPPAPQPIRINAGGPAQTVNGVAWQGCTSLTACGGYVSGGFRYAKSPVPSIAGVLAPANAAIYQTEWTGGQTNGVAKGAVAFTFDVPVAAGAYKTRLHFAENVQNGVGKRIFDVNIEGGAKEMVSFDLYKAAGGMNKVIVREFTHSVTDGKLTLQFIRQVENAKISGIEIIPLPAAAPQPVRINAGGPAQTVGGVAWQGCTAITQCGGYVTGGFRYGRTPAVSGIVAPANQAVYQTEWTGGQTNGVPRGATAFTFRIPVINGGYLVRLHFAEIVQNGIGKRVFDVNLEGGAKELAGFDVFAEAGGLNKAFVREFPVTVADGQMTIEFVRQVENAKISGIEIIPRTGVATASAATLKLATLTRKARASAGAPLSGRLISSAARGGRRIVVERRLAGSKRWRAIAVASTNARGDFRVAKALRAPNAAYRARFAGDGRVRPAVSRAVKMPRGGR